MATEEYINTESADIHPATEESPSLEENLTVKVNALYNLWKNGKYVTEQGYTKNRYAHIPSHIERKYGKKIRALSKNMKVDSSEQPGLLKSSVLPSLLMQVNPLFGIAAMLGFGMSPRPKHALEKRLDEMSPPKPPPTTTTTKTKKKLRGRAPEGGGVDWSKYGNI